MEVVTPIGFPSLMEIDQLVDEHRFEKLRELAVKYNLEHDDQITLGHCKTAEHLLFFLWARKVDVGPLGG